MSDEDVTTSRPADFRAKYRSSREAEARVLLLIDGFSRDSRGPRSLEGRVKLAKLDFYLRYPKHLAKTLEDRGVSEKTRTSLLQQDSPLESRMVRYRYGPWDPSHFAILGSLIGRGLVEIVPSAATRALGYRTTDLGAEFANRLREDGAFEEVTDRVSLLRRHLDLTGEGLKKIVYQLPDVSGAAWHEEI
ncbi:hypothetical protein ACFVWR_01550 [Leifsonia sp. NPDC058292]|uniref:hypothetical protein n=1 Tax=Leifsonia sp. NPDC058292 TaxID=3346428 RepID=UPI0036D8D6E2